MYDHTEHWMLSKKKKESLFTFKFELTPRKKPHRNHMKSVRFWCRGHSYLKFGGRKEIWRGVKHIEKAKFNCYLNPCNVGCEIWDAFTHLYTNCCKFIIESLRRCIVYQWYLFRNKTHLSMSLSQCWNPALIKLSTVIFLCLSARKP